MMITAVYNPTSFVLAIDTDAYSGNFERELCAYVTGQIGDCGVGEEMAAMAQNDVTQGVFPKTVYEWVEEHLVSEPDEYHCCRPASIWITPGWYNNGMGGHFKDSPENDEEALQKRYESIKEYNQGQLDMVNNRIKNKDFESSSVSGRGGWTKDACIRTKKRLEEEIEEARQMTKVQKWPAYLSVAIFFDEAPPKEVVDVIINRAKIYATDKSLWPSYKANAEAINISGVRVLEPSVSVKKKIKTEFTEIAKYEV
jgi:hypothetical protein